MQSVEIKAIERDSIGLAVSKVNGCNYCLTVHSFTAEHMAKLPADEIMLARKGHASDPKRDAAVRFARKAIETRGKVSDRRSESGRRCPLYGCERHGDRCAGGHVLPDQLFQTTCSIREGFPPLRRLARSELYPVASTMIAWQDQVVVSQSVTLQNERNEIDIRWRQMAASLLLIKTLGRGRDTSQLPIY